MTALQMVANAAVKVGLAEARAADSTGAVQIGAGAYVVLPLAVRAFGLAAVNRVYLWVWHQFPYREQRLVDVAVPVLATEATVSMPYNMDVIRSVWSVDRALYPISEVTECRQGATWLNLPDSQPLRFVNLPDGVDSESRTVRRIKLVPPSAQDITLYVNGLRRFVELAEGDAPLLTRTENALFDYVVAELFEFNDDQERADKERSKAAQELTAALEWQETIEETDTQATPLESFMD